MDEKDLYSWRIIDDRTICKKIDSSILKYNQTGIPKEIRKYWDVESLGKGEKRYIDMIYEGKTYQTVLCMENNFRMRTKLYLPFNLINNIKKKRYSEWIEFKYVDNSWFIRIPDVYNNVEELEQCNYEIEISGNEGRRMVYYSNRYERNANLREMAIKIHGLKCIACKMNFAEKYGKWGDGFIEIHHLKPLYSLQEEVKVDPRTDLFRYVQIVIEWFIEKKEKFCLLMS